MIQHQQISRPGRIFFVGLLALLTVSAAVFMNVENASAGAGVTSPPISAGSIAAEASLRAEYNDASEDFWTEVANAANGSLLSFFPSVIAAVQEWEEAWEAVGDQYEARLEIIDIIGGGPYNPPINPANFTSNITNPYLPYVVGQTLVYETITDEGVERIEVTTLAETQIIAGVECRAVRDVVTLDGECIEDTTDWFAQDLAGNVWYFGEISKNFEDGLLDNLDGSWRTGKDGAKPGIVMPAMPAVGMAYRQEFLVGEAEDFGEVLSTTASTMGPTGSYSNCVLTADSTPLEPGVIEHKIYALNVGLVSEVDPESGETVDLIAIINN